MEQVIMMAERNESLWDFNGVGRYQNGSILITPQPQNDADEI
jgi:hypothetical protein